MTYFEEQRIEGCRRCPAMIMLKSKKSKSQAKRSSDPPFPSRRHAGLDCFCDVGSSDCDGRAETERRRVAEDVGRLTTKS